MHTSQLVELGVHAAALRRTPFNSFVVESARLVREAPPAHVLAQEHGRELQGCICQCMHARMHAWHASVRIEEYNATRNTSTLRYRIITPPPSPA
ncbi:MAG: hypothetical protein ACK55Z_32545, partial [bacterium]